MRSKKSQKALSVLAPLPLSIKKQVGFNVSHCSLIIYSLPSFALTIRPAVLIHARKFTFMQCHTPRILLLRHFSVSESPHLFDSDWNSI